MVTVVVTPTPAPEPTPEPTTAPAAQPAVQFDLGPGLGAYSVAELVRAVTPWVASITTEEDVPGFFNNFDSDGAGSGFVIRQDGYVVTNWHVVQGADNVKVHLPNGRSYDAEMVGRDAATDLAVLKIDADRLPTAKMASVQPNVGDWVMAMGNALALKGGPTVTLGIVSGLDRSIQTSRGEFYDLIQTDAAVNVGNSGGPLVNMEGEVVGVNQATLRQAEGISFAINSSVATPIIDTLIRDGFVVRPTIGLNGRDLTPAIAARYRIEGDQRGRDHHHGRPRRTGLPFGNTGRRRDHQDRRDTHARPCRVPGVALVVRRGRQREHRVHTRQRGPHHGGGARPAAVLGRGPHLTPASAWPW